MDMITQRINRAHNTSNTYRSPIADTYNGNTLLQNYIKARLTNRQTIRLLLDQNQLQSIQEALAEEIAQRTIDTIRSLK